MNLNKIILLSIFTVVIGSCRKSDNSKLPPLTRIPQAQLTLDPTSDKFIPPGNPASFKGKFTVDLYYKNGDKPSKMDVVVRKNDVTVKVLQAGVSSFPTAISITGQQLIDLFGPIADGDKFEFGADVYNEQGQKFEAFPVGGPAYAPTIFAQPGASPTLTFLKPCTFVSSAYQGSFKVLQDDWQDYSVGSSITVKSINATQISFEYAVDAGTAQPIVLTIDPATNAISVTKQVYGSYGGSVFTAKSVAGSFSAVNPCDLSLSVRLTHETTGFSGDFTIRLKKN